MSEPLRHLVGASDRPEDYFTVLTRCQEAKGAPPLGLNDTIITNPARSEEATCPGCRAHAGLAPLPSSPPETVHLTLDQGYSIACRPLQRRTTIEPLPAVVEIADIKLVTCPRCWDDVVAAVERSMDQAPVVTARREIAPASLERIAAAGERTAAALERIADVLDDPHRIADIVGLAIVRSR